MVDVEGPQEPSDISTRTPIDEPMHDAQAEVGFGQRPDSEPLQEQVVADVTGVGVGWRRGPAELVEASTASRRNQGEVIH